MELSTQENRAKISTKWIENLALEEINMEQSGVINFSDHLNPSFHLEESSIEMMNKLRDLVEIYTHKFNEYRGNSNSEIKIFKIANTVNDFMVFRNSLRLIFARRSDDLINIGFLANGKDIFSARTDSSEQHGPTQLHEIRAHIGPFNKISWKYQNEEIELNSLVKHYITEFVKLSAR